MPLSQVANVSVFEFGAPATTGTVLQFRVKPDQGGKLDFKFENPEGDNAAIVSVEVSADNSSWAATTAGNNLAAITALSVGRKHVRDATILVRRGVDLYLRVRASGSTRCSLQLRGDEILEPMTI